MLINFHLSWCGGGRLVRAVELHFDFDVNTWSMRSLNEDIKLLTLKLCVINLDAFMGGFSKKDCEFEIRKTFGF